MKNAMSIIDSLRLSRPTRKAIRKMIRKKEATPEGLVSAARTLSFKKDVLNNELQNHEVFFVDFSSVRLSWIDELIYELDRKDYIRHDIDTRTFEVYRLYKEVFGVRFGPLEIEELGFSDYENFGIISEHDLGTIRERIFNIVRRNESLKFGFVVITSSFAIREKNSRPISDLELCLKYDLSLSNLKRIRTGAIEELKKARNELYFPMPMRKSTIGAITYLARRLEFLNDKKKEAELWEGIGLLSQAPFPNAEKFRANTLRAEVIPLEFVGFDSEVLEKLKKCGFKTIGDLDEITPKLREVLASMYGNKFENPLLEIREAREACLN